MYKIFNFLLLLIIFGAAQISFGDDLPFPIPIDPSLSPLNPPTGSITADAFSLQISASSVYTNLGIINLNQNSSLVNDGAFNNGFTGILTIDSSSSLVNGTGNFTNYGSLQAAGSLSNLSSLVNNGTISSVNPFVNAGSYSGTGVFTGSFSNQGVIIAGDSLTKTGTSVINGSYNQTGELSLSIYGDSNQRLSTGLRINNAADDAAGLAISSRLRVTDLFGLAQVGDKFTVMDYHVGTLSGTFGELVLPDLIKGKWNIYYNQDSSLGVDYRSVVLEVTLPEPQTYLTLGSFLLVIGAAVYTLKHRRKTA